jgi:cyclase
VSYPTAGLDARRSLAGSAMTEISDGLYAYVHPVGGWCVSNSGVLVGRDGLTLIDTTATVPRAELLRDELGSLSNAPVRSVITTHHHGDHHYGNATFRPGASIIAHDRARECMIEDGLNLVSIWPEVEWGEITIAPPTITFGDRMTMYVDDLRVELIHYGPAHTVNDIVAWIPERRVLYTGDVAFSGGTPFCMMGSIAGSLTTIEKLRALEPEVVVCGHGPVAGPEVFDATAGYLEWIQRLAADAIAAGLDPLSAARETDLGEFAGLLEPERIVGNLHRAYAEARGGELGERIDVPTAFGEMVTYNGGRTPACHA